MQHEIGWPLVFGGKLGVIAAAGWLSTVLLTSEVRAWIVTLVGIVALVLYRRYRKFRREAIRGLWDFADRNMVELILAAVIAPSAVRAVLTMLGNFIP